MSLMIELILTLVLLVLMARRRGRRRWTAKDANLPAFGGIDLLTVANATVVKQDLTTIADNEYRCLSMRMVWTRRGGTAGEGPLVFGVAHGDYSVTEIKECLEAEAAWTAGNKVANEQANRLIRRIGVFSGLGTDEDFNDGKPVTTRLNWLITEGQTIDAWAYNQSGAQLATGAFVMHNGTVRIRWE